MNNLILKSVLPSVQSLGRVWLFATAWTAAHQAFLSFTISRSLLKLVSIESVMPSNHLILCHPLILLPSIFPSIRVFSFKLVSWPPCYHQIELAKTHVHWISDAIQPSHPLSPSCPPAFSLPQNQGLFQWVVSSHQVAKGLELQLRHQSFQWVFRTDFL